MRFLSIIAGLAATWFLPMSSVAQEGSVKLVAFQYPPLVYLEHGEVKGTATRLVRAIFDELGIEAEIETLPWARALQYMQHGQADAVFTIFRNPERERFLLYTDDYLIEQVIRLYVHADRPIDYGGQLPDLAPYRIGVTQAVSYGQRFDRATQELFEHITYVNDEESKFLLLDKGRVDVVVSSTGIADFYLRRLQLEERIRPLDVVIERVPSYLAFSRASAKQGLAPRFEAALQQLKATGRYRQIIEQQSSHKPAAGVPSGESEP